MVAKSAPYLARAERVLRPRVPAMSSYAAERAWGVVFAILAGIVSLPIPFGNQPPAIAMAIMSIGLIERDGLCIAIGLFIAVLSIVIASAVVVGGAAALYIVYQHVFGG
jgi:hypothetical protein